MRAGSLFSGYGGLSLAAEQVFGATAAWVSDIDPAACRVLERRFPDAPNLGDITTIDWATVEQVDIIEGGSPCQDVSSAGKRAGMTDGTRSNLWVVMRDAIATIKPTYVIWENVYGAHSAAAASSLEPCTGCVGDGASEPNLRALGRVLGDLAELGFDAEWRSVRASDVGACHQRRRVFVLAWRRGAAHPDCTRPQGPRGGPGEASPRLDGHAVEGAGRPVSLLPTPVADNSCGLPSAGTDFQSLPNEVVHRWGQYADAIARHEHALGRPAPEPTIPTKRGGRKLSGEFTEWMMMLPAGWIWDLVTDGTITNNAALKLCGNGVVTPQAVAALTDMLAHALTERTAA